MQLRAELRRVAANGEQLLLTLGIPVMLLVFFSLVDVLPTDTKEPIDFLAPGILALATMSTAMVSLGIGTGFERSYHVLKRLGTTPLGRPRLITAKIGEEVVRLRSHLAQFRDALNSAGETGKMLDFLLQELNREANTTLSKSTDLSIKEAALGIKAEIEKIREQVQNVE